MSADDVGADDAALRAAFLPILREHFPRSTPWNCAMAAAALAAVPRPVTQPDTETMLALGERMEQACAEAYQRGLRDGRTTPSQPAHGEAPTEAEDRAAIDRMAEKWGRASEAARRAEHHFPTDCLAEAALYVRTYADRLAAQPTHGDNEAALRAVRALADEYDSDERRARAYTGADIGAAIRLWLASAERGQQRCICPTDFCIGVPGDSDGTQRVCRACRALDPEEDCIRAALSASAEPQGGEERG